jgi:hypothetical protein
MLPVSRDAAKRPVVSVSSSVRNIVVVCFQVLVSSCGFGNVQLVCLYYIREVSNSELVQILFWWMWPVVFNSKVKNTQLQTISSSLSESSFQSMKFFSWMVTRSDSSSSRDVSIEKLNLESCTLNFRSLCLLNLLLLRFSDVTLIVFLMKTQAGIQCAYRCVLQLKQYCLMYE